jgi:predicted Zn-dependent protease
MAEARGSPAFILVLICRSHRTLLGATLLLAFSLLGQRTLKDFHFSPPDEILLEDANELDRQFEKRGLLYRDPTVQEYLDHIGKNLRAGAPPPDRVVYRFQILRAPMAKGVCIAERFHLREHGLASGARNEVQLASVLGQEITHVTAPHLYLLNRNVPKKAVTLEVIGAIAGAGGYFPAASSSAPALRWLPP